jgi:hypothetical protein
MYISTVPLVAICILAASGWVVGIGMLSVVWALRRALEAKDRILAVATKAQHQGLPGRR